MQDRDFGLPRAAAHSDCMFAFPPCTNILAYLLTNRNSYALSSGAISSDLE